MASPAAVLSILVEANTKAANASLAKTDAQLRGTAAAATATNTAGRKTATSLRKMGTAAKWAGLAIGAAFVIEAKKAVTTTQDLTKSTISLHKNLGLSNKQASEWAGVAKARGVDTTKLGMAFKTLSSQIVAARDGSATSIDMFKRLGFTQKEMQRASHDTQFAVENVADGLNKLAGGADKTAIQGKLFGRGWATIAPVMRDGSKAMQEQLDLVEKYGGVLQGKTLKAQTNLLANIRENKIAWQGFQVTLATAVTPALNAVSKQFQRIAAINANPNLTGEAKWRKISHIIDKDFRRALDIVVQVIPEVASRVGQAAPKIAEALVKGFLDANVWGKLFIGAWLIKKMGGWALITALGSRFGTRFGTAASTTAATTMEGGLAKQGGIARAGTAAGMLYGPAFAAALAISLQPVFKKLHDQAASGGGPFKFLSDISIPAEILPHLPEHPGGLLGLLGVGKDNEKKVVPVFDRLKKHYGSLGAAARESSRKQRQAWLDQATAAHLNGDLTLQQLQKLTNTFSSTGERNRKMWRAAAQATGESVKSIKRSVGDMKVKVGKDVAGPKGMVEVVGGGVDLLAQNLNQSLGSLGVAKAKFMVSPTAHPGHGQAGTRAAQRGAFIPGVGDGDKVPVMAEPGEGFINKKAVRALGGKRAIDAINSAVPRFQRGGVLHLARGGMAAMVAEANKFEAQHFPYRWGGGHGGFGIQPVDCSGAVSDILHAGGLLNAPMVSGDLARWGKPGKGSLTVYANPVHTFMSLGGKFFGTSGTNPGGGAGWMSDPGAAYRSGFAARTMPAAMIAELKRVILKGPAGALKDMGQAALDKTWKAAKRYLNKQTPAGSFGGGQALGDWKGINSAAEFIPFWNAITGMKSFANAFAKIVPKESGWNPRASNGTHFGWYQFDSPTWSDFGKGPVANAFNPGMATQAAGNVARIEGWPGVQSRWAQTFSGKRLGGVVAPYVGSFDKGGQVASTGLGMLHQGETVVPGMQHGGMAPTIPRAFLRMLRRLVHFGPEDRHTRRQEARFLHQASRLHDLRQLNAITKALDKFGVKFTKTERDRLRHLAHEQRHPGLTAEQKERLKVVQRSEEKLKRAAEAQGGMTPAIRRQLKRLQEDERKLLSHRGGLTRAEHREVRQLRRERHQAQAQKEIRERLELQRELISEFKQLRQDMKADRRERHEVRVNESAVFRALRNFMGREIGYQYAQSRRNVSPGSAVRY